MVSGNRTRRSEPWGLSLILTMPISPQDPSSSAAENTGRALMWDAAFEGRERKILPGE